MKKIDSENTLNKSNGIPLIILLFFIIIIVVIIATAVYYSTSHSTDNDINFSSKQAENAISTEKSETEKYKVLDLFKDLDIEVTGISPELTVTVNNTNSNTFIQKITYTITDEEGNFSGTTLSNLSNDETITITANYGGQAAAQKAGVSIEKDSITYKINSKPTYKFTKEDINKTTISRLDRQFKEALTTEIEKNSFNAISNAYDIKNATTFTTTNPTLVSMYLLTPSKYTISDGTPIYNKIYAIYKVTFTAETREASTYDYYYTLSTSNIALDSDKEFYMNILYNYTVSNYLNGKEFATSPENSYNYFIDSQKLNFSIEQIQ